MHRSHNSLFGREIVTIFPGEVYVTTTGEILSTVLGSCIAVCLGDPVRKVWGMNHFMLPTGRATNEQTAVLARDAKNYYADSLRYGTHAMELLIGDLQKAGAERKAFRAKVFGGAHVLRGMSGVDVGQKNILFIRSYLHLEKIPTDSEDVDGEYGRKIFFVTAENRVLRKHILPTETALVTQEEEKYVRRVATEKPTGTVDLF